MTKDMQGPAIRALSASINKANALDFDSGYAAGFDRGRESLREALALELEKAATMVLISNDYNFNDTAIRAKTLHFAAEIVRGKPSD